MSYLSFKLELDKESVNFILKKSVKFYLIIYSHWFEQKNQNISYSTKQNKYYYTISVRNKTNQNINIFKSGYLIWYVISYMRLYIYTYIKINYLYELYNGYILCKLNNNLFIKLTALVIRVFKSK